MGSRNMTSHRRSQNSDIMNGKQGPDVEQIVCIGEAPVLKRLYLKASLWLLYSLEKVKVTGT